MCRYAMTIYKPHYACFECRKTFKRLLPIDIEGTTDFTIDAKCPQCGNLMADMGLDFESPRKNDLKSWKHIKDLFKVGITFHSCGCGGWAYIPATNEKMLEYLECKKAEYIRHLRFWLKRQEPTIQKEIDLEERKKMVEFGIIPQNLKSKKGEVNNSDAINYWNEKIKDIDNKIQSIKPI